MSPKQLERVRTVCVPCIARNVEHLNLQTLVSAFEVARFARNKQLDIAARRDRRTNFVGVGSHERSHEPPAETHEDLVARHLQVEWLFCELASPVDRRAHFIC